ncbi:SRPBCC family protein [Brucella cytisi]|uniref:SRPBCC family protein n=1 Tax=Brucella cytisi TaxID=407152 RepID=UPI0035D82CF1
MNESIISLTVVNHIAVEIAADPSAIWNDIVDSLVEAKNWLDQGFAIEPLNDPSATKGGYRMSLEKDGIQIDLRTVCVTECDTVARRLSLLVDYLSAPDGVLVFATYQAQPIPTGTRYTIDCHTRIGVTPPGDGSHAEVAALVSKIHDHSDAHLASVLAKVKAKHEAYRRPVDRLSASTRCDAPMIEKG